MAQLSAVSSQPKTPDVAVVAIGSELTAGQTLNRNAQWISQRLTDLGLNIVLHEAVPDDRALILKAFDHAAEVADLLIITGGLGPTTDDFTREMIAEWSSAPLHYRDESWQKIVTRLNERGIEVAPSNRKQCFFPLGSTVLENSEGTADGFRLMLRRDSQEKHLLILPGPPREGMHLWDRWVESWLKERFPGARLAPPLMWRTLGKSESALGEIVEAAVTGLPVTTGYRASAPYVEVKVWVSGGTAEREAARARVEAEIGAYTITRGTEDLLQLFFDKVTEKTGTLGLTFLDLGSGGALTDRLLRGLKTPGGARLRTRVEIMTRTHGLSDAGQLPPLASEWLFALFPDETAAVISPEGSWKKTIPSPYSSPLLEERNLQYRSEKAVQFFLETLSLA